MSKRKPHKPTGTRGQTKITIGSDGVRVEFQPIPFPRTQKEIEAFIVDGFLRVARQQGILQTSSLHARQNELDDFDFSLTTPSGNKYLELMEIAPLEHLGGSHAKAPNSYKSYDFAQNALNKIKAKSDRYATSTGQGLLLLIYVTDWRFNVSDPVVALLQYWTLQQKHNFEGIFFYSPTTSQEGLARLIYPTPLEFWKGFNPELYRDNITVNLSPTNWSIEQA